MKALLVVKPFGESMILTLFQKQVLAKPVPAAAVIQVGQALFGMTGRKGYVGGV